MKVYYLPLKSRDNRVSQVNSSQVDVGDFRKKFWRGLTDKNAGHTQPRFIGGWTYDNSHSINSGA